MKNLSDIMAGQVPGLNEKVQLDNNIQQTEKKIFGNIGTEKLEPKRLSIFDTKLGLLGNGSKISLKDKMKLPDAYKLKGGKNKMGIDNKSNMLGFNKKPKSNIDIFSLKPKSEMNVNLGFKSNMNSKVSLGFKSNMNPKVSLGFSAKTTPKLNFKDKTNMLGSSRLRKNVNAKEKIYSMLGTRKPGMNPQRGMKNQKGLSLFGDFDKDGVKNIFDCNPRNKNEQGIIHKVANWVGGRGYVEDEEVEVPEEEYQTTMEQDVRGLEPVGEAIVSGLEPVGEAIVSGAETVGNKIVDIKDKIGSGTINLWQASGLPEYLQERKETKVWEQDIKKSARKEGLKEAQKIKAKQIYESELKKTMGISPRTNQRDNYITDKYRRIDNFGRTISRGIEDVDYGFGQSSVDMYRGVGAVTPVSMSEKIKHAFGGQGMGSGQGVMMMAGVQRQPEPFISKVQSSVGLRPSTVEQMKNAPSQLAPIQQIPVQQQMYQQPYQGQLMSRQNIQQNPQQGVISPFSKRKVTYVRGPYNKAPKYQAYAQY